jgi:acetoin utilization protein AcuC
MHHARAGAAQGFCYLNDPVLAILRLRREGLRVIYVDIDAHHGDGVEAAFRDDPAVLTLSLHMDTGYAYPFAAGTFEDQGSVAGGFTTLNVPLPRGVHDAEYELVFDAAWYPALERFRPDAVVLQAGADALFLDPLARLNLTTQGFLAVAAKILDSAPRHAEGSPRLMVTGGGGYHLLGVARAWAGLWALLAGRDLPEAIPPAGQAALRATGWDLDEDEPHFSALFQSRLDAPADAPVRPEIRALAERIASHRLFRRG